MKCHRPQLQSRDRFFFARQRLFLNSGFLVESSDADSRCHTGKRQWITFFCFCFSHQLGFPDFCLVWKGGKSLPYTSAGQHRWTEHLPLSRKANQPKANMCFFLSSSPCKNFVSVNKLKTFCRNAKSFKLAVINIPLGFCLKLHPTDKSRRKSLNL